MHRGSDLTRVLSTAHRRLRPPFKLRFDFESYYVHAHQLRSPRAKVNPQIQRQASARERTRCSFDMAGWLVHWLVKNVRFACYWTGVTASSLLDHVRSIPYRVPPSKTSRTSHSRSIAVAILALMVSFQPRTQSADSIFQSPELMMLRRRPERSLQQLLPALYRPVPFRDCIKYRLGTCCYAAVAELGPHLFSVVYPVVELDPGLHFDLDFPLIAEWSTPVPLTFRFPETDHQHLNGSTDDWNIGIDWALLSFFPRALVVHLLCWPSIPPSPDSLSSLFS